MRTAWLQLFGADDGLELHPGVTPREVTAAEEALEAKFPDELAAVVPG
jgi:hypothetical protein